MKLFRNVAAKNNAEVTNIHFCEAEKAPTDFGVWEECTEEEMKSHKYNDHVFTQAGVRFYGKV